MMKRGDSRPRPWGLCRTMKVFAMIHPFAGILGPAPDVNDKISPTSSLEIAEPESTALVSRRVVLGWLSSAAVAPWLASQSSEAADKDGEKNAVADRALHYVVPKEGKKISPSTLKKLDIGGGGAQGWPSRAQFAKTPGYWAWVDEAGAEKIRQEESVETIEKFGPEDVQESGTPGGQRLMVQLAPNGWNSKPKRGSFHSAADLAKQWTKDVGDPKVMFRPAGLASVMVLSNGPMPNLALNKIKECPQVVSLQWAGGGGQATTQVVGEEGGGVTTQALGEEGGQATTRAVGEEGGRPPLEATTKALGEEGGR